MTHRKNFISGINYLISPEDTTIQPLGTASTTNFTGLLATVLGAVKTLLWSAIAVIVPVVLL